MKKILYALDQHMEEVILGIFLILITCVVFLQIIFRYVLKSSLIWPEEFARYCLVCSTLLSLAYCVRRNIMMKVDIVANLMPKPVRKVLNFLILLLSFGLYSFLFYYSIEVAATAKSTHQLSTAMRMPMYLLYGWCTAALALTMLRTLQQIILIFRKGGDKK